MRKFLLSLLLLAGVATTANQVFAGDGETPNGRERFYHNSHSSVSKYAGALGTSPTTYGDSTYVGYSPGNGSAANPWSIRASITNAATSNVHRPPAAGCMWNWDPAEAGGNGFINGDTLQGWWPLRFEFRYSGPTLNLGTADYLDPGGAISIGNLTNYYPVNGRTFGVVGAWHADQGGDPTGAAPGSNGVTWVPLQGSKSAWCGLRIHGDATAPVDPITHNPFTADAAMFNTHVRYTAAVATPKFPGYVDSWDQMLYKDVNVGTAGAPDLSLHFVYSTRLSTAADILGWFDRDPLTVTSDGLTNCAAGNFISNFDVSGAGPVDSFMVYVGLPVEGTFQPFTGTCVAGVGRQPIYDPLRRWFDEIVEANDPGKVIELVSAFGNDSAHVVNVTIPNSQIASILAASGGKVRVCFRVKTNTRSSDVTGGFNSAGRGAAQVDDVTYSTSTGGSSPAGWGDFEAAGAIDNTKTADAAWRSTGKPPSVYAHVAQLGDALDPYDDLCGSNPAATGRICSASGGIISFGGVGLGGRIGSDVNYTADHDLAQCIMSPTIQLRSNNGTWPNTIGIQQPGNQGDAIAGSDWLVDYEVYAKAANLNSPPTGYGLLYRWLFMGYPQLTNGGQPQWGNIIRSFANYQTDAICFRSLPGITGQEGTMLALGMFKYSVGAAENANYPDSMKIGWLEESECWADGVNSCNPVGGLYLDNVSAVAVDGAFQPLSGEIWNFWQTAFPWNENVTPAYSAAFDTAGILVKTGLDIGPPDGLNSFDVPGDTIVTSVAGGATVRVDLVFRVLPGPGNYRIVGNSATGLTPNPAAFPLTLVGRPAVVPNVASSNFWESFLANNGPFGTPGGHTGGVWNPNVWNSARADTAEINLFPRANVTPAAVSFQSTFNENELGIGAGDAYSASTVLRAGLGLKRHKCFLSTATAQLTDIDCQHDPDGIETPASGTSPGIYDLTWVLATGSGYGGDIGVHPYGRQYTIEGTKIIPDGLLTPGAHVEYFWRKAVNGSTALSGLMPDTTTVVPQPSYRDNDGRRFQAFGALPDRWKESGRVHPLGLANPGAPACMLVVNDQTTNKNDWQAWTGTADTIGVTSNQKWGADIGWHAKGGGLDINVPANNIDRAGRPGFIAEHGGNQGTTWDAYQIIGAEDTGPAGSFGARYAHQDASNTQINDKRQQGAPTLEQLKFFYKTVLWMQGVLNALAVGPQGTRGSDDQQLIKDWLLSGSPASAKSLNRIFWAMGDGFVEGNEKEGDLTKQPDLDLNYLGAVLENTATPGYRVIAGPAGAAALRTTVRLSAANDSLYHGEWGVRNVCDRTNDVLKVGTGSVQAFTSVWLNYEDPNPGDAVTYPASIYKKWDSTKPWAAITEEYSIFDLVSSPRPSLSLVDTKGRNTYFSQVLWFLSRNSSCQIANGQGIIPLDVPNISDGNMLADFVNLRNNPLTVGLARIHFGLAKDDRVQIKVYDVAGREIRQLADRAFKAGEHDIVWDGTDNAGRPVARGVYFSRLRYRDSAKDFALKMTVLK